MIGFFSARPSTCLNAATRPRTFAVSTASRLLRFLRSSVPISALRYSFNFSHVGLRKSASARMGLFMAYSLEIYDVRPLLQLCDTQLPQDEYKSLTCRIRRDFR